MSEASRWLIDHAGVLPAEGDALDVACGTGRHALWLARRGLRTRAVDVNTDAVARLNQQAREESLPLHADVVDLETGTPSLGVDAYDVIVVVHYLHRALFPALIAALRPGGLLMYETFTVEQAKRGKPTNPAFLLAAGELRALVDGLQVLDYREGEADGKMLAGIIARKAA